MRKKGKIIYIHCSGGHGRVGLIGSILYGKINNVQAVAAIKAIELSRETRIDKSRNFIPTPETTRQVAFVGKILGIEKKQNLPDRSDRSWLKKVKEDRKKQDIGLDDTKLYNNSYNIYNVDPDELHVIRFYTDKKFLEFSNYYIHKTPLIYDDEKYISTEHIFQVSKFNYKKASNKSIKYSEIIRDAKTPNIARELASQKIKGGYPWRTKLNPDIKKYLEYGVKIRPDWDEVRDQIMKSALTIKFTQDKKCAKILLSTGNSIIIEHTSRDNYWGNGGNDSGENRLGKLLMEVRSELRKK